MVVRIAVYALLALGLAGFGAVLWFGSRPAPADQAAAAAVAPQPPVKVLAAAHSLRAGSLLKPDDIGAADMPADKVPAEAIRDTPQQRTQLWGAMVRRSLGAGYPLLGTEVMRPGDHGFLAAVLEPNLRAVTIGVDMVSGGAGLIWPGDRVDLILTQTLDAPALPSGRRLVATTVLDNIRVIAVDQRLVEGATPDATEPKAARTVTLEVTAQQAERVSVAQRLGQLSLVVRAADQPAGAIATRQGEATWAADVSPALNNPEPGGAAIVHVFQGNAEGKDFRF
jgi:pilus assembly protein CpaB